MKSNDNANKRAKNDHNSSNGEEDRLSALPDTLLVEIISRLPLESAVATATLSRRWQPIITQLTSINVYTDYSGNISNFWIIFCRLICKLIKPLSHRLSLNLHHSYFEDGKPFLKDSWFRQVCGSSMEEIRVRSHGSDHPGVYTFIAPCTRVFQIKSLVTLELGGVFAWGLPAETDHPIHLPKLKKLTIHVAASQFELLGKFLNSSLPSLEDLSFHAGTIVNEKSISTAVVKEHDISISIGTLKRLHIYLSVYVGANIIIDTPKLEDLKIAIHAPNGYSSKGRNVRELPWFYFVQEPTLLSKADIMGLVTKDDLMVLWVPLGTGDEEVKFDEMLTKFYKVISNAKTLMFDDANKIRDQTLFPNVTHLHYKMVSSKNCQALMTLLGNCPALDVLTLDLTTPLGLSLARQQHLLLMRNQLNPPIMRQPQQQQFVAPNWSAPISVKVIRIWVSNNTLYDPINQVITSLLQRTQVLQRLKIKVCNPTTTYHHQSNAAAYGGVLPPFNLYGGIHGEQQQQVELQQRQRQQMYQELQHCQQLIGIMQSISLKNCNIEYYGEFVQLSTTLR